MRHLLVHANTFARIEAALKPFAEQISPITLSDEGDLKHPWGESEADAAIVYATQDAYFSPAVMTFFQVVMNFDRLDWFQSAAAGTEHSMLQAIGHKAALYSGSHEQSEAIAEWVLWAGLDFFQRGPERRRAQSQRQWARLPYREMSSTHWLIVGFGAIGRATAKRLKALGAEVTGVRRSGGSSDAADRMIKPSELAAALPGADVVVLSLPLTEDTESLANADFFAAMQTGSLFINIGRGGLVDEPALLDGLEGGRPVYASLDVLREEPQPESGPFWDHPRVTLTAHISALTEQASVRTDQIFLQNLERFLRGGTLLNQIAKEVFS